MVKVKFLSVDFGKTQIWENACIRILSLCVSSSEGTRGLGDSRGEDERRAAMPKMAGKPPQKETGGNGGALQTEMNAVDCSQWDNDRRKGGETKRERESIREGSWSVMVPHSRAAVKGKGGEAE